MAIIKGIKYIKINRFDEQGNDNTLSLQELTNVRLSLDDLGIVDFPVLTITEYPDYYLYRTADVILGDSIEGGNGPISEGGGLLTFPPGFTMTAPFNSYDPTGSIDNTTGLYTFVNGGYSVTANCYFTASAIDPAYDNYLQVIFTGSQGIKKQENFAIGPYTTSSYTSSVTFVPIPGETLGIMFSCSNTYYITSSAESIKFHIIQDVTSSIDNNVLDYSIDVYKTGSFTVPFNSTYGVVNYDNIISNPLGYFDSIYGALIWGSTSNVKLQVTASVYSTASIPPQLSSIILYQYPGIVIASVSGYSGTITLSSSIVPLENTTYYLGIENTSNVYNQSYNNVHLVVTQSTLPHSSTNLTVLEPYLLSTFTDSDCDVLMNNADSPEYDVNFMKVDYDGNGGLVIPSNQQQILNNTAERAPVKPYNYRLLSQIRPRYLGTKNSTDDFNLRTTTQVAYEENSTNENLGATTLKQPSVSSLETYFAYFDQIGGTSYELIGMKGAHIVYLIDKDGNTLTPSINSPYYSNLLQNFSSNKKVNVIFDQGSGNLPGIHPVIKTGLYPRPTIWSQSGSTENSSSNITFGTTTLSDDFTTTIGLGGHAVLNSYLNLLSTSGSYNIISALGTVSTLKSGSGDITSNHSYIIASMTSNQVIIKPRIEIIVTGNNHSGNNILFRIATITPYAPIYEVRYPFTATPAGTHIIWDVPIPSNYANPTTNSRYEFYLENYFNFNINLLSGGAISLLQDPSLINLQPPYWNTGSSSNILVAVSSSIYGAINQFQIFPTSSEYISNIPLTFERLDEIRFEGDENQTYIIIDPNYNPSDIRLL